MEKKYNLKEELAALEHEQWMEWSKEVAKGETLSEARLERWKRFWVPYEELSEADKNPDRYWSQKVWNMVERHLRSSFQRANEDG